MPYVFESIFQAAVSAACVSGGNNNPSGLFNSFGYGVDTATIGQLFIQPATCSGRVSQFTIFWPNVNLGDFAGRGFIYEFNPVTRQTVGRQLAAAVASIYSNGAVVSFLPVRLQPATQYAFIVTTSGLWNGRSQSTVAVDTVSLSTPFGQYPGALQGAVILNSGNDLSLVTTGTYTLEPYNFNFAVNYV